MTTTLLAGNDTVDFKSVFKPSDDPIWAAEPDYIEAFITWNDKVFKASEILTLDLYSDYPSLVHTTILRSLTYWSDGGANNSGKYYANNDLLILDAGPMGNVASESATSYILLFWKKEKRITAVKRAYFESFDSISPTLNRKGQLSIRLLFFLHPITWDVAGKVAHPMQWEVRKYTIDSQNRIGRDKHVKIKCIW